MDGGDNIRLLNNTSINSGTAVYATGHAITDFVFENNIVNYGDYGIMGDNSSPGSATLAKWFPGAVVLGSVMPNNTQPWTFPLAIRTRPTGPRWDSWISRAGTTALPRQRLHRRWHGGSTPGANIDALEAAMTAR